jgi:capsular exopolysaccharide synthesis family protein
VDVAPERKGMSKFFKAFEQAEQDRSPRENAGRLEGNPTEVGSKTSGFTRGAPHRQSATPRSAPASEGFDGIDEHLVSLITPTSFEAEQYQTLRHVIEQGRRDTHSYMVAVSSPAPKDGKTLTAINLAGALAMAREVRVLLVEIDLRRPSVPAYLGLGRAGSLGLVDAVLDPTLSLEDVVKLCALSNLAVLPAGRRSAASYEVLGSPYLGQLLEEARRCYDYLILDAPPLLSLPDCRLIDRWIDGLLVVVAAHKTPRKLLEEALNIIDPTKMLGLVFNNDDRPVFGYHSYYSYDQSPHRKRRGWLSWR